MTLKRAVTVILMLCVACAAVATCFICLFVNCPRVVRDAIRPADIIAVDGLKAKISHSESCWESCSEVDDIEFFTTFGKLGEKFFLNELGLSWQPYTNGVLAFPAKAMLLTIFSDSEHGAVVTGLSASSGKPHAISLMGCMNTEKSRERCAATNEVLAWWPAIFLKSLQVSYHHRRQPASRRATGRRGRP